ncbi:acyl-protein thioesterase 2-like isoform X2 [Dendronephthya gigantea]|nr:acyl-protein thioesterase 2-like isoform X2 [Dendronephthya gigantea]XP_028402362.1 acyl-protein thioesterase 2-like isoform X2 [Dendronephthya gigantea]
MPVTLNGGLMMPSWFDLYSLTPTGKEDEAGIKKAADKLKGLIAEEEKLVPCNRIIIGGFSQGGAVSMYTALTLDKQLGGLLCLSTWLPLHKTFPKALKWHSSTPVLQCHGEADPMVPFSFGKMSSDLIKSLGSSNNEFKTYPGLGHSSNEQEMSDIKEWISGVLPSKD